MRTQSRHSGYNRCATAAELHRTSPVFEPETTSCGFCGEEYYMLLIASILLKQKLYFS